VTAVAPVLPARMARLPRDRHGRPIPWFVHVDEAGVPDFRVIRARGIIDALHFEWCWVCGGKRGKHAAFVVGPMCAVNRTSAEPPSHLECALYSAQACPFLTTPAMGRRERGIDTSPEGPHVNPAGTAILRNPGVALVWSTRTWHPFDDGAGGMLFDLGRPTGTSWWAHGRPATRGQVLNSIESGLPLLQAEAEKQRGGVEELERMRLAALAFVPT
jgi:hypothetical protein